MSQVKSFTDSLDKLIEPYLGKREFGNLRRGAKMAGYGSPFGDDVIWGLGFETVGGSSLDIAILLNTNTGEYEILSDITGTGGMPKTSNPQEVLGYVKKNLDSIQTLRREGARKYAESRKRDGEPLDRTLAEFRKLAGKFPKSGPTDEEVQNFEMLCKELYRQN